MNGVFSMVNRKTENYLLLKTIIQDLFLHNKQEILKYYNYENNNYVDKRIMIIYENIVNNNYSLDIRMNDDLVFIKTEYNFNNTYYYLVLYKNFITLNIYDYDNIILEYDYFLDNTKYELLKNIK
jgi:hypothetical protein